MSAWRGDGACDVRYDDGDEQWEPLGTRTQFKWAGERQESAGGAASGIMMHQGEASMAVQAAEREAPVPSKPKYKRMLSEKSQLAGLPEAKHSISNDDVAQDVELD